MSSQEAFDMVRRYRREVERLERALIREQESHGVTKALLSVAEARINRLVKQEQDNGVG